MQRWTSKPIQLPGAGATYSRADLIFQEVEHGGPSFEARVFLDRPDADEETPLDAANGYVGSFHIFGHGGCFGDQGHCDIPQEPSHDFDYRPPHQLTPHRKAVIATDGIRAFMATAGRRPRRAAITVVAIPAASPGSQAKTDEALRFAQVTLALYE